MINILHLRKQRNIVWNMLFSAKPSFDGQSSVSRRSYVNTMETATSIKVSFIQNTQTIYCSDIRCACRHCRFNKCLAVGMDAKGLSYSYSPAKNAFKQGPVSISSICFALSGTPKWSKQSDSVNTLEKHWRALVTNLKMFENDASKHGHPGVRHFLSLSQ